MTLKEWIAFYDRKTNSSFKRDENAVFLFLPDKGFCELYATKNLIVIGQMAGDGRFWRAKTEEIGRRVGLSKGGARAIRKNVCAYIRLFGFKIERTEDTEGEPKRYFCRDKKGFWLTASPASRYDTGEVDYYLTWSFQP